MKRVIVFGVFLAIAFVFTSSFAAGEYDQGKKIFDEKCSMCHGTDGKGNGPAASAFSPSPVDFTKAEFWQRNDIDEFITSTIENGHGPMQPIPINKQQIKAVIDYMEHTFKPGE